MWALHCRDLSASALQRSPHRCRQPMEQQGPQDQRSKNTGLELRNVGSNLTVRHTYASASLSGLLQCSVKVNSVPLVRLSCEMFVRQHYVVYLVRQPAACTLQPVACLWYNIAQQSTLVSTRCKPVCLAASRCRCSKMRSQFPSTPNQNLTDLSLAQL